MSANIKATYDEWRQVVAELRDHDQHIEARGDDGPTAEDEAREAEMEARETELRERLEAAVAEAEKREQRDAARERFERLVGHAAAAEDSGGEERSEDDILRAIGQGEQRSHDFELRDLSKSADASAVGASFSNQLYQYLRENATVLQDGAARVINTATGESLTLPKVATYSTGALVTEAATIAEDDPTFSTLALSSFKFGRLADVSSELVTDALFDIGDFLAFNLGSAVGRALGADLVLGTNITEGVTETTTNLNAGSTTAISSDNLIDLQHTIASPYRTGSVWLMKDSTVKAVRKLQDTTDQYIWQPGLTAGAPSTLLGNPVLIDDNMPAISSANKAVVYGNLQRGYVVRLVGGVRVDVSTELRFASDQVAYRALVRADGGVLDDNAIATLTMSV